MQVPRSKEYLKDDDVFILDMGTEIYQWNGRSCNKDEKFKVCVFSIKIHITLNHFNSSRDDENCN